MTKLAFKIDEANRKRKGVSKRKIARGFDQMSAPFHEGILPSQFNLQQSELERVGRTKRRKEW